MSARIAGIVGGVLGNAVATWLLLWVWNPFHLGGGQQAFAAILVYELFVTQSNAWHAAWGDK